MSLRRPPTDPRHRRKRDLALLVVAKIAVGCAVWASGFRAVSDDDFARVVLMQQWAAAPKLDPTGTSWLPFPFWLGGSAMLVFGRSIEVARGFALLNGCAAVVLLYLAARTLVGPRHAFAGALLAAWFPWSAYLGVATVPELLTAALCVFALSTALPEARAARAPSPLWGGAALLVACLSRYEAWVLSGCFVLLLLWSRCVPRTQPGLPETQPGLDSDDRRSLSEFGVAAALALLGPALWMVHNVTTHGSIFHFAERVSAFHRALHGAQPGWREWLHYPAILLRQEPELWLASVVLLAGFRASSWVWPRTVRPMVVVGVTLLATLCWAAARGGAPTHHAGRSLLTLWLLAAIFVGAGMRRLLRSRHRSVTALAVIVIVPLGLVLRPRVGRFQDFANREQLVYFGAIVGDFFTGSAREVAAKDPIVLLDVSDYGYFAIEAGSANATIWVLDRSPHPHARRPESNFRSCAALATASRDRQALGRVTHVATNRTAVSHWLGPALREHGGWALYSLPSTLACAQ